MTEIAYEPGKEAWENRTQSRRETLRELLKSGFPETDHLVLEIGCGHGHFLTNYAAAHPNHFAVGIDLAAGRIDRCKRKQNRHRLENLRFIRASAADFLDSLPPQITFDQIFILFPDPWPKKRHHKNRLLSKPFLARLAEHSGKNARLCFRTDYSPYFQEVRKLLATDGPWRICENESWPFETETIFQNRADSYESLIARLKSNPPSPTKDPSKK